MAVLSPGVKTKLPAARDSIDQPTSHLGKSLIVRGLIDADGEVHIHGTVSGRINADTLVLRADGYVEGDIVARDVRVEGRFNGRIFALNVTVEKTANVIGRIFHNTVSVAFGARVDGRMPWRPPNYFETLDQLPETRP
jgi:cytoskeletal protein CcmA (bactofilin family)